VAWKDGFYGKQMMLRTFIANINRKKHRHFQRFQPECA